MNVHISYRLHKTPAVEKDIQHHIEKLRKRLRVFRPELIQLKGTLEEASGNEGVSVSLNLHLPSGQMAAQSNAPTTIAAVKIAFAELLQQVNKHKELLRSHHKWQRRQTESSARRHASVPFEQTLAAVFPATVSPEDVRSYVNANLSRLERFVEREIYLREVAGQITADSISKEEVVDETILAALGDEHERHENDGKGDDNQQEDLFEKPERIALEPWLYRLAIKALNELSRPDGTSGGAVRLEESARRPNVKASDEPELQFHQPDESMTEETIIADGRVTTPEQIVGSDEMMHLIASALRDIQPVHREAFILHAIEGFGVDEIAVITGVSPEVISSSISAAREHLRKSPNFARQFKGRFASTATA